jgi:hypothetical protein
VSEKLTASERTRDLILSVPERHDLAHDWEFSPVGVAVVWWVPGDRSRVVRVTASRRGETRVASVCRTGELVDIRVGRPGHDLIRLVRSAIGWLRGDTLPPRQATQEARGAIGTDGDSFPTGKHDAGRKAGEEEP